MNIQDLRTTVPALFQTEKLSKLSDRYTVVPTIDVVEKFIENGWQVSSAKQVGKTAFAKHQVRLRNSELPQVGDSLLEAVITNSHNGSSTLQVGAGLFRLVCSNGLTVPVSTFGDMKQTHLNLSMSDVELITEQFVINTPKIQKSVTRMMEVTMDIERKIDFVSKAVGIRWKNTEDISTLTLETIIDPLRDGDSDDNLWTTFNVVQEKLIRGGFIKQQGRNTRSVKGIQSLNMDNMINTKLWELAETFC
jgi:hypothetical protein